ncbi:MAG: rhomboid family intramembrane serine protease [archaeon]
MKIRSVIMPIIIANVVMFVLQMVLGNGFTNSLMLTSSVFSKPYQLLTSMFLHGDINHIFFNMYGLMIFGPLLEQRIGWKRFAIIYFLSGLFAGLGHVLLSQVIYGTIPPALGASGAIMGMIGTLIILMPDLRLLLFFFIPMNLRTAGILWALTDAFGIFFPTGIGNIAHLIGMATGLLFGLKLKKEKIVFISRFERKSHLSPDDADEYMRSGRI